MDNATKLPVIQEIKGIGDLTSKNSIELNELLERQEHLLKNRLLISKLKDKGEKIKRTRNEITRELEFRYASSNIASNNEEINNTACEWGDSKIETTITKSKIDIEVDEKDPLKILSENGMVPKTRVNKTHIKRLIDKEKDPNFTFKPFNGVVAAKIKNVVPNAHTKQSSEHSVKIIHLDESLNLLTQQLSVLKVFSNHNGSKRAKECIQGIMNDSNDIEEEIIDEFEEKSGISVNINLSE